MTDLKKPVSGRVFAKMVGVSEGAVRKAANGNTILKGRTPEGKYIPLVAAREWGKDILPEFAGGVGVTFREPAKKALPAKQKPVKEKPVIPATAQEFVDEDDDQGDPGEYDETESGPLTDSSPKSEAERRTAIFKARTAELLYQEKKGEMIPRSKMRVLFEYGSQIRAACESLPDKLIDDILANADDRQVAKRIFVEGVHAMLSNLSDPEKINL